MNNKYYEAKLLLMNRIGDNAVDIDDLNEFTDEVDEIITQLEAENATFRAELDALKKPVATDAWIDSAVRLPERDKTAKYSNVPCLVIYEGIIQVLCFNHEHMVWDDAWGDDFKCEIGKIKYWMPLPALPEALKARVG